MSNYIRVTPFDKNTGAMARRVTVGGMLFEEERWYELDPRKAAMLRPLKQDSGAPLFQIIETEEEWREITRRELAMAMVGPTGAALADLFRPQKQAPSPLPKEEGKTIPSSFGKLSAKEVEPAAVTRAAAADLVAANVVTAADVTSAPPAIPAGLDELTREELVDLARSRGLEVDGRSKKSALIALLKDKA